jgi:hypothetical protein
MNSTRELVSLGATEVAVVGSVIELKDLRLSSENRRQGQRWVCRVVTVPVRDKSLVIYVCGRVEAVSDDLITCRDKQR